VKSRGRPLSAVAQRIKPAVFAELQSRIDALAAKGIELVPLQIGDTHVPPPEAARKVLSTLDPEDTSLHRYGATSGLGPLRAEMARVLRRRGLDDVDPEKEILVGNGGTHSLFCAAGAVLDPGDEVLLASPYWPLAPGVFTSCGVLPVDVPLTQRLFEDPNLDPFDAFAAAKTDRTRGLYFISPNNPDGKVLTQAQIERIADFAKAHDLWVFADEVYADVVFDRTNAPPSIASMDGMRERTIVLHSLSKSHALAGLRVGFVAGPERVIAAARRISTHTAFNVSVAMQRAALAALADDVFPVSATATYRDARDRAAAALKDAPIAFHLAEGATYFFLDFAPAIERAAGGKPEDRRRSLIAILERAVDRGVLLAPGDAFGPSYVTHARLCYTSVPIDRVLVGIERLRDAVDAFIADRP
jgi:aspartate/methionine/tyrosine aminotransferase